MARIEDSLESFLNLAELVDRLPLDFFNDFFNHKQILETGEFLEDSLILKTRILDRKKFHDFWDAGTQLLDFILISYPVATEKLRPIIPPFLEIMEFQTGKEKSALVSAVSFVDHDFHFRGLPFLKFQFPQTNYRVYVRDTRNNETCVWFLKTTLGSSLSFFPRIRYQMPWLTGDYSLECNYNKNIKRYETFKVKCSCVGASLDLDVNDTGVPMSEASGFGSPEELKLILTHPVSGFYRRNGGGIGNYRIWHKEMKMTVGVPIRLYFSLFERLGLISLQDMQKPHSVFICPSVYFEVYLPPEIV